MLMVKQAELSLKNWWCVSEAKRLLRLQELWHDMMVDAVTSKVREGFISHLLFGKISVNPKDQAFL